MHEEEVILLIADWFKEGRPSELSHYGYDVYLPSLMSWHFRRQEKRYDPIKEEKSVVSN